MKNILQKTFNPLLIIVLAVLVRLLPHIPNVTPIAGMALFGGAYLNKKYALVVPLVAMVVSDGFLGFSLITPFVYGSFLLIGLIGLMIRNHKNWKIVLVSSLVSSLLFFLITNFGVWVVWDFYPKTLPGLAACYVAALPFFRNTILGDVLYTGFFFGGYEVVSHILFQEKVRKTI